jgi:drug/metabolite transporter (DMT)-like permease
MGLAQLAVPALATLGAVALLGEHLTAAMAGAAFLIFSGIALALYRR